MEYTKGEWEVFHPLNNHTVIISDDFLIGNIEWETMVNEQEQRANANLISASPDMYRALKGLLNAIAHRKNQHLWRCKAYLALIKAEGESQGDDLRIRI